MNTTGAFATGRFDGSQGVGTATDGVPGASTKIRITGTFDTEG